MNRLVLFVALYGFSSGMALVSSSEKSPQMAVLIDQAIATHSSSFIVMKENEVLVDLYPDAPAIECHSITKSLMSLGIGILIDQGKIHSVDQPLSEWFPEWKSSPKQAITLRHLLTHTSGLKADSSGQEIYQAQDCIQVALSAELVNLPGEQFFYNNKAVNLLSGVIEQVSGKRTDLWFQEQLFNPLGIKEVSWSYDAHNHTYGHAGLKIRAHDLAKLGQLMLNEGEWEGKQVISQGWLKDSLSPSFRNRSCGLLWWLWGKPVKAYAAVGYRGQYLIVIPESKIIVVRQVEDTSLEETGFENLPELLLIKEPLP